MRDLWDTRVAKDRGFVKEPNKLTSIGIKRLVNRAIWAQGLQKKLLASLETNRAQISHLASQGHATKEA
jgi:hypothetical protein